MILSSASFAELLLQGMKEDDDTEDTLESCDKTITCSYYREGRFCCRLHCLQGYFHRK